MSFDELASALDILTEANFVAAQGVQAAVEAQEPAGAACPCGCGGVVKPGRKWAREGCRQRFWNSSHLVLNIGRRDPALRAQAERMAEEAVRAAKFGQVRATVDARAPVIHAAVDPRGPDHRPSCRVRLDERRWQMLADIQRFWHGEGRKVSFSEIVKDLIDAEFRDIKAMIQQEEEHE